MAWNFGLSLPPSSRPACGVLTIDADSRACSRFLIVGLSPPASFPSGAFTPEALLSFGITHRTGLEFSQTISVFLLHTLGPNNPITIKGYKKVRARSPLVAAPEPALHPAGEAESRNAPRNTRNVVFSLALVLRIPRVLRLSSAALLFAGLIFFVRFVYFVVLCSA